jgi:pentatricopeptide repeat protein
VKALSKKEKLLATAQKSLLKGQVAKAVKDYEKIVEGDPGDVRNRQKLGELYNRAGMSAEALDTYASVAKHYANNGFYLKAIAVYKQMQKVDAAQSQVYYRLGELNEKQGLRGNALAEYRQLVQLLRRQGKDTEAIQVLDLMKALDPDNLKLRLELVAGLALKKEREKAAAVFRETLGYLHKKKELLVVGPLREALQAFFPDDVALKIALAGLLVECGDGRGAIELLQEVLTTEPQHKDALPVLAEGYRLLGEFEKELEVCQQLLGSDTDNLDLRENFVRACLSCESGQLAFNELESWKESFFENQRVLALKGFYEQLKDLLPENEQVRQTLHAIYEITGEGGKLFDLLSSGQDTEEADSEGGTETGAECGAGEPDETQSPVDDRPSDPEKTTSEGEFHDILSNARSESDWGEMPAGDGEELEIELEITQPALDAEGFETDYIDFDNLDLDDPGGEPAAPAGGSVDGPGELEPAGVPAAAEVDAAGELEEAEFYFQQGLLEEAAGKCRALLAVVDDCKEARQLLEQVRALKPELVEEGGEAPGKGPEQPATKPGLKHDPSPAGIPDREKSRLDGSLNEFKKGLESQVGAEDTETHFNLGIAYQEMGLLDDAIAQFDKAKHDRGRRIDCLTLKGGCLAQKGEFENAVESFREGLAVADIRDEERTSLYYELGLLYLDWKRPLEALDSFQCVADVEPFFRHVDEQIRKLRKELGLDDGGGVDNSGNGSNKNRVSYI